MKGEVWRDTRNEMICLGFAHCHHFKTCSHAKRHIEYVGPGPDRKSLCNVICSSCGYPTKCIKIN